MQEAPDGMREGDPLALLEVLDRIEIGPVEVESERISMPYRVLGIDGSDESNQLIYRWQEPVFDPNRAEDLNLAAMIGSQLALNYGLFARTVVFRGEFDRTDQAFLRRMMENTAREIYVHKFLLPNPFLRGSVTRLPVVRKLRYSRAKVEFEPDASSPTLRKPVSFASWPAAEEERIAVLSSGGKDSLLSFGLLDELGYQVHPLFVNESGRHWMTALNGYRWFERNVDHTARVWTNSDRLFAWMLRRLPFVRPDFQQLRSDEYPIRLWTVAVFAFGVLPLLRKRGIAHLVIGDEYDTSDRKTERGVPHYNGLYDQSRWFDRAMTGYSRSKGWRFLQFSILRSLSELLIQKTLAERYPSLLESQMSCHAAHSEDGRVHPCGDCEKCRRIVAMLLAVRTDPRVCGYRQEHIEKIVSTLSQKGVRQERPAIAHLGYWLHRDEILERPSIGGVAAAPRPEISKLRFHPERSPIDDLPVGLRRGLYTLLLEHCDGAVERVGREWLDFDLLSDAALGDGGVRRRPRAES